MNFDPGALNPSGRSDPSENDDLRYFFLDRDAETDPSVKQLQDALMRNLPALRRHILRVFRDESVVNDYIDRLYGRLRKALGSIEPTDSAIWSRLVSLVHEDYRQNNKRRVSTSDLKDIGDLADPSGLEFLTDLFRKDEIDAFRDCLDDWIRQVFDVRLATQFQVKPDKLAKHFGLKRNTFDQRWRRGLKAGIAEYRRRRRP
jgi:hypothetical protein